MNAVSEQTITCAFCRGKGTDPYDQLSSRSRCEACHGAGTITVPVASVSCAYCRGSGSYKTFRCLVCKGAGIVVPLPEPTQLCPACGGLAFEFSSGMACLRCRGRGRVATVANGCDHDD